MPFVARYRKEATGGLDDAQLRTLEERLGYLRELEERRGSILEAIDGQGKLTPALKASIEAAETKQRLEDLYLPYKVKRRTKAEIAREAGLEPLADALLASGSLDPEAAASAYLREPFQTEAGDNPGVPDTAAALEGARWIVMERLSEDAELLGRLRDYLREHGVLVSKVLDGKDQEGAKFRDYFEFARAHRQGAAPPGAGPVPAAGPADVLKVFAQAAGGARVRRLARRVGQRRAPGRPPRRPRRAHRPPGPRTRCA